MLLQARPGTASHQNVSLMKMSRLCWRPLRVFELAYLVPLCSRLGPEQLLINWLADANAQAVLANSLIAALYVIKLDSTKALLASTDGSLVCDQVRVDQSSSR